MKQRLAILGSTGSIGVQTLDIVRAYPDLLEITTLTSNNNWEKLSAQAREFMPDSVVIANEDHYDLLCKSLQDLPVKVYSGQGSLEQVVRGEGVDTVVMALVGYSALFPTISAIKHRKKIALANKECLVVAGEIVMSLAAEFNTPIIPVDSEHSAIFQCLVGEQSQIDKVILTASGGPFLNFTNDQMRSVTVENALNHPNWSMGAKITIDSATMMNKGFEVIEAKWLFGLKPEQIQVVVHPSSVIHSMVQFSDGAIKAQLGTPDMHLPIQYALTFPKRLPIHGERLNFTKLKTLEFFEPDLERFPNLRLAYECLKQGGDAAATLNAANEITVQAFLSGEISFVDIARINEKTLNLATQITSPSLSQYVETDRKGREIARMLISKQA